MSRKKTISTMFVGTAAVLVAALGYSGDAGAVTKAVTAKCKSDYKRLCPGYKVDTDDLRACMRANYRAISNTCMNALIDAGEAPPSARKR